MIYLCELCGKSADYRYRKGFQMLACRACANELGIPGNWERVSEPIKRPDLGAAIDEWRLTHYGSAPKD